MPDGVRRIAEADWELARELRLRALRDSPDAFAATHAEEHAMADAQWQARARSNAAGRDTVGFFALDSGREVGTAVGVRKGSAVELNAMWVAPEARRQGAARALVEAVAAWARELGAQELTLEVTHTSLGALALYRGLGFVESGEGSCGARRASALKMRRELVVGGVAPRALILDFLAWIAAAPRSYSEVMDAWRTSCPRLTVWEDALDEGLVCRQTRDGEEPRVELTAAGRATLALRRS